MSLGVKDRKELDEWRNSAVAVERRVEQYNIERNNQLRQQLQQVAARLEVRYHVKSFIWMKLSVLL